MNRQANKLSKLRIRNEDSTYYDQACRHAIEEALANHPEWGRDGKYSDTSSGIRQIVNSIKESYFPFKLEAATLIARNAWARTLRALKNEMMQKLEANSSIEPERDDDIDRKEPVDLTDPEEIRRFMDARGISLNEAAKGGDVTMATVISFRKKVKTRLRPEGKQFLAYLKSMGYEPGCISKIQDMEENSRRMRRMQAAKILSAIHEGLKELAGLLDAKYEEGQDEKG